MFTYKLTLVITYCKNITYKNVETIKILIAHKYAYACPTIIFYYTLNMR